MRFLKASPASFHAARPRKAFSLVEVVLAVGVLAVSVLALLGMMGPAFRQAKGVTETNAATAVIGKLNAVLQEADFADIYTIVNASRTGGAQTDSKAPDPNQMGMFIFYTEESFDASASSTRYRDRVAYFSGGGSVGNASNYGWQTLSDLSGALTSGSGEWRVMPPVIAVVVSLSPIVKDQAESGTMGTTYVIANPYKSTGARLFPTYTLTPINTYPLGMMPIMASVFVIPNPADDISSGSFNTGAVNSLLMLQNRIFTFQAVKLR